MKYFAFKTVVVLVAAQASTFSGSNLVLADEVPKAQSFLQCNLVPDAQRRFKCFEEQVNLCFAVMKNESIVECFEKKGLKTERNKLEVLGLCRSETRAANQEVMDFGRLRDSDSGLNSVSSQIKEVIVLRDRTKVITLDNGQVWQELSPDRLGLTVGDKVVIKKGAFRSFNLKKTDAKRITKVKRVQ